MAVVGGAYAKCCQGFEMWCDMAWAVGDSADICTWWQPYSTALASRNTFSVCAFGCRLVSRH
jgi:hypothetical protein